MFPFRHSFSASALYRHHDHESLSGFLSKRWSFWLALFSCIAFLIGNMVGQHGFRAFWKSVWGKFEDRQIVFTGTVLPVKMIPDPLRYDGGARDYHFEDIPEELFTLFPSYVAREHCGQRGETDERVFSVRYMGDYEWGGDGCGSHPAVDILVPKGTPVFAIANGIVDRTVERSIGFGNTIVIRHPNAPNPDDPAKTTTLYSVYAHLSEILVQEGDIVTKGEQVALSGQTGFATAPHVHFQIDRKEAKDGETTPFHPYWPFTTTEAEKRNLSFVQAINAGLGKERGERFTVSPLLYVQKFLEFGAEDSPAYAESENEGVLVAEADIGLSTDVPLSLSSREKLALKRQERLSVRRQRQRLAEAQSPVLQAVLVASVADPAVVPVENNVPLLVLPEKQVVFSLSVVHDGKFDSGTEELVLFVRDAEGNFLQNASFQGNLRLETIFGEAKFSPAELTSEQFDERGRAFIRMFPIGLKTIVPVVRGTLEADGAPMVFGRQTVFPKGGR